MAIITPRESTPDQGKRAVFYVQETVLKPGGNLGFYGDVWKSRGTRRWWQASPFFRGFLYMYILISCTVKNYFGTLGEFLQASMLFCT